MRDVLPVTALPASGLPTDALVTGDPQRVPRIAQRLDACDAVASRREYLTYRGSRKGTPLLVASHGVGAPGAVLLFHELARAGVTTVVRAGACGALVESIADGDLIVATGAVREDGVTDRWASPEIVEGF